MLTKTDISIGNNEFDDARAIADAIINGDSMEPRLFRADDHVYEATTEGVRLLSEGRLFLVIGLYCRTGSLDSQDAFNEHPPSPAVKKAVRELLADHLPELKGVARHAFVWDSGDGPELINLSGQYHQPSGVYCLSPENIDISMSITESMNIIEDYFGEFAFDGDVDRVNGYAPLLGLPLKVAYGNQPMTLISKPTPQTGATKLARSIGWIAEGKEPARMTIGRNEEETDKRLGSRLKYQPGALIIDNVSRDFANDALASGMTADRIRVRLLGANEDISAPTSDISLFLTANNPSLSVDMLARSVGVRIDAKMPNPCERSGFRHQLPEDLKPNSARTKVLSAVCSISQRWIDNGCPEFTGPVLDSFGVYMKAVGGILAMCGLTGYNSNRDELKSVATSAADDAFLSFVIEWWAGAERAADPCGTALETPPTTARDLMEQASKFLTGEGKQLNPISMGKMLSNKSGQVFDLGEAEQVRLVGFRDRKSGKLWKLTEWHGQP